MHNTILAILRTLDPFDLLEAEHLAATRTWVESGVPLCRIEKPATPPQHLVSYFILVDRNQRKLLLVDHKNAGLWLPSGGHVEPGEHPQTTVEREAKEELDLEAHFLWPKPLFLTVTQTVGASTPHIDVSFWYVLAGDCNHQRDLWYDPAEFHRIAWFAWDELPLPRSDPHLARFTAKLIATITS